MSSKKAWFAKNVDSALKNEAQRVAIQQTTAKKMIARAEAVKDVDRFDDLRDLAAQIKQHTLDHLEVYLKQFADQVQANGGTVHHADDAQSACRIIADIARREKSRICVKVKSMTTEEIDLNGVLQAGGLDVVETDLGEFIVQLDDDRPSHIVTPIIHKNRFDVARIFERELGVAYTEDPETLTMHARRHLRDVFARCDLGISGANFAVAESGSICICTNEGNGRYCTTRPRVHIALIGIEKLIPRLEHLPTFLKVLSRSGTGQQITVYASLLTGAKRVSDADGPEHLHVVLLDNGRREILNSEFKEALRCIRCGACLNACPVFSRIGGHAYGGVYPGPIGKLISPLLMSADTSEVFEHYSDLPQASSLCGMCREVCPARIDIPELLIRLRSGQVGQRTVGITRNLGFKLAFRMLGSSFWYRVGQGIMRLGLRLWNHEGWIRSLPWPFSSWTMYRDVRVPAAKSFRRLWRDSLSQSENEEW